MGAKYGFWQNLIYLKMHFWKKNPCKELSNQENEPIIITDIERKELRRFGHEVRMREDRKPKEILEARAGG